MKLLLPFIMCFVFILNACITPYDDFVQNSKNKYITIEASLSNEEKAHEVRVSLSSDLLGFTGYAQDGIRGATVYILDDKGNKEIFLEQKESEGLYFSSSTFTGKIGTKYVLFVETPDGEKYQSNPEEIPKMVPEILNPIVQFVTYEKYPLSSSERNKFNVYVDFQDSDLKGENYSWGWTHFEKTKICEVCTGIIGTMPDRANYNSVLQKCNDEKPTGTTDFQNNPITLAYRCDTECYTTTLSTDINIFSDLLLNGKRITGVKIATVPFDDFSPYYLKIEQRSISNVAYKYYNYLQEQIQTNGTLFDVPAQTVFNFNIKSTTNSKKKVIGIFNVFGIKNRVIYVDRSEKITKNESPFITDKGIRFWVCPFAMCNTFVECNERPGKTKKRPIGWID